ncbi:MAG: hypothetical protein ACI3XL_01600 [Eubacteriales bacterium]
MKKLIPAFALLLISAVVLSTASYAWFSMNTSVSATGMTINAQVDSKFLVIEAGSTFHNTTTTTSVDTSASSSSLKPVAPATTLTAANVTTPTSWQYGYSNSADSATVSGDYTACTNLTGYVASETFSIGLNAAYSGSTTSVDNLKLTSVTLPASTGISVVVVCGTNIYNYESSQASLTDALADTVTTSGVTVTVYYYINGDDTNVYSSNATTLTGSVQLTFAVD